MDNPLRHCEEPQATRQSRAMVHNALDCFASLEMTNKEHKRD